MLANQFLIKIMSGISYSISQSPIIGDHIMIMKPKREIHSLGKKMGIPAIK